MQHILLFGALGGLLPDVIRVYRILRSPRDAPESLTFGDWRFWVSLVLQVALGAFAVWFLEATTIRQAIPIGFSAPELLTRALSQPESPKEHVDRHLAGKKRGIDLRWFGIWWAK